MVTYSIFLSFQLLIRSVILGISVSWEKVKFWSKVDSYRLPPRFFNILDSSCLLFFSPIYTLTKPGGGSTHIFSLWFLATETGVLLPDKNNFLPPALPADIDPFMGHSPLLWTALPYRRSSMIPHTCYLCHLILYEHCPTVPIMLFSCNFLMALLPPHGSNLPGA